MLNGATQASSCSSLSWGVLGGMSTGADWQAAVPYSWEISFPFMALQGLVLWCGGTELPP